MKRHLRGTTREGRDGRVGAAAAWRRLGITTVVAVASAAAFPVLDRFTYHPDETVILQMPPGLGALLWWGWPRVRRTPLRRYLMYAAVMVPVLAVTVAFVAYVAGGRVLWSEVFWAFYFFVAWRMGWGVWKRTAGRLGERLRRWGRRTRRAAGGIRRITDRSRRKWAVVSRLIGPFRFALTALVFAPLVFGALIHRVKIGNPTDLGPYSDWPLQAVQFRTVDGLTLSGWFLPEKGSDSTVVICHGSGANKGNFLEFVNVFRGRGYSSLIFDFRGHGASDGHTCTFGLYEEADIQAAVGWLKTQRPQYARHIFGLGSSIPLV